MLPFDLGSEQHGAALLLMCHPAARSLAGGQACCSMTAPGSQLLG